MSEEYDVVGDALALLGLIVGSEKDNSTVTPEDLGAAVTAVNVEEMAELLMVVAHIAVGLMDVVSGGDPQEFLRQSASTRGEL